jgi:hypothetical protein
MCAGAACPFAQGSPGDTFSLGSLDPASVGTPAVLPQAASARVLLFSDDPESVTASGILYQDAFPAGPVRLFVYHVNGDSLARKFSVVLQNTGTSDVTAAIAQSGVAGPSPSYGYAGAKAVERWLASGAGATVDVPAGATVLLDAVLDGTSVATGDLLNAIYDLDLSGPLAIAVVTVQATTDTVAAFPNLSVLPRGSHQRGTYAPADVQVVAAPTGCAYDTSQGALALPLGVPGPGGAVINGTDATLGTSDTLGGQYGVWTTIVVDAAASDGRSLALALNPRGGAYQGAASLPSGVTAGGVDLLPPGTASVSDMTQAILVGLYAPDAATPTTYSLGWMMTGGSSDPVDLLLIPY